MWCTCRRSATAVHSCRGDHGNMCRRLQAEQVRRCCCSFRTLCCRQLPNKAKGNRHDLIMRTLYCCAWNGVSREELPTPLPTYFVSLVVYQVYCIYRLRKCTREFQGTATATRTTNDCCSRCSIDAFSVLEFEFATTIPISSPAERQLPLDVGDNDGSIKC